METPAASGTARSFLLGLSAQPSQQTEGAFRDAFELAEMGGETILIQRTPPWSDFLAGSSISQRTENLTRLERELADRHDLTLMLAIDPTEAGDRGRIAGLPEGLADADFEHPAVRAAFVAYAKYLALNYQPSYMALGVEVDLLYARLGPEAFESFLSLYEETYDEVKAVSPRTLLFPTFQYESMLGILDNGGTHQPTWSLVQQFGERLDLLAVSSYPGLVFETITDLPANYYQALEDVADVPIALVSLGWSSAQDRQGEPPETGQVTYLYRVLAAADDLEAHLVIWHLGRDPEVVPEGFEAMARMGMYSASGQPKNAWRVWLSAKVRPSPALP